MLNNVWARVTNTVDTLPTTTVRATLTQTLVSLTTANKELLAAAARDFVMLQNRGSTSAYLSVDGDDATTSDLELLPGESLVFDAVVPQGQINGIRSSGTANIVVISG